MKDHQLKIVVLTGGDRADIMAAWEDLRTYLDGVRDVPQHELLAVLTPKVGELYHRLIVQIDLHRISLYMASFSRLKS